MHTFYLGTHHPAWIRDGHTPLCISDRRLRSYRTLPTATDRIFIDSGAFTVHDRGEDFDPPAEYAARVRRYVNEIGQVDCASIQDWMCEPHMIRKTGLSVLEHQNRTTRSALDLTWADADLPWLYVVQGYTEAEYRHHIDIYAAAGIDLTKQARVGVGSVCKRSSSRRGVAEVQQIFEALRGAGLNGLHGFGLALTGIQATHHLITTADSMAWSFKARRLPPLDGCTTHINCANCRHFAYQWAKRARNLAAIDT